MGLNAVTRSRLKLTIAGTTLMSLALGFPMFMIYRASLVFNFDMGPAWGAFSGIVVAIGTGIGYYVNKESQRPSLLSNTTIIDSVKKILPGEDESDPEKIPL